MRRPESQLVKSLLQLLASVFGGVVVGVAGGFIGSALGRGSPGGWGDLVGAIVLGAFGGMIGAGLGAFLAGKRLGQPASWWLAIACSLVAGVLVFALAEPLRLNASPVLMWGSIATAVPLAAVFVPRLFLRK